MLNTDFTVHPIRKYIGIISVLLGIYGLIPAAFTWLDPEKVHSSVWNLFSPVSFQLFIPTLGNHLEVVFHLMLLIGGITYMKSTLDRSGLLRFCFSVIFFSGLIRFLFNLIRIIHPISEGFNYALDGGQSMIISFPYSLLLLYFTFIAIRILEFSLHNGAHNTIVDLETNQVDIPASKSQRFTHFLIDFIIATAMMSPFMYLIDAFFKNIPSSLHSPIFISLLIGQRFIYYYSLEKVFQSTPAKYLTGTRVVNDIEHTIPSSGTILLRTLYRFIPLEAFTFFGETGLHDRLSNTTVVNRLNAKPGKTHGFLWIGCLVVLYFGYYALGHMRSTNKEAEFTRFENQINDTKQKDMLNNLSQDHVVLYESESGSYNNRLHGFAIEHLTSDSVWGYSFNVSSGGSRDLNILFSALQDSVKSSKQQIARMNIDSLYLHEAPAKLFATDTLYTIKGIYALHQPIIDRPNGSSSHRQDDGSRSVTWTVPVRQLQITLLSIQNIEGDIVWTNTFPEKISWNSELNKGEFNLTADNFADDKKYKALLTMKGADKQPYAYFIEGMGGRIYFYRKY